MKRKEKYIRLNSRVLAIVSIAIIILSVALVTTFGHKSLIIELQISISIIAVILFLFMFLGLYIGVKVGPNHLDHSQFNTFSINDLGDLGGLDISSLDFDDIGTIIISILLWILVAVILAFILFFVVNLVWGVLFFMFVSLYWIFYRAYRQVFIKSRKCKGRLLNCLGYSSMFTILYTGWLFVLVYIVKTLIL